ncbi:hypothetical protein PWT90_07869 [Aphanocladium album]|nr:hypothetical protein PWT90_07869 [Aphanocladium album]
MAAPIPKSVLGRHRLLAPLASVRASRHQKRINQLTLEFFFQGIGNGWASRFGECTKEMGFDLLDTYYDLGGNFIDTANVYQGGDSERWIGEWMAARGNRSEMVISTKYSINTMAGQPVQQSNFGGSGTKSMQESIQASLKNLQTSYIDIYYVHAWDYATQIPELMQSLNTLVQQGKVLYLGISNAPAWVVAKANAYARQHGLRPFSIYQGRYSASVRDMEREILPMCRDEGMAVHAYGILGHGQFKAADKADEGSRTSMPHILTGREAQVSAVLEAVAKRHGVPITSVSLAYVMQKTPYLIPVVGGRKVEQLKANVEALSLELTPEDVAEIDNCYAFDAGYPHNFINLSGTTTTGPESISHLQGMGFFDYPLPVRAPRPHTGPLDQAWKA